MRLSLGDHRHLFLNQRILRLLKRAITKNALAQAAVVQADILALQHVQELRDVGQLGGVIVAHLY